MWFPRQDNDHAVIPSNTEPCLVELPPFSSQPSDTSATSSRPFEGSNPGHAVGQVQCDSSSNAPGASSPTYSISTNEECRMCDRARGCIHLRHEADRHLATLTQAGEPLDEDHPLWNVDCPERRQLNPYACDIKSASQTFYSILLAIAILSNSL